MHRQTYYDNAYAITLSVYEQGSNLSIVEPYNLPFIAELFH